MEGLSCKLGQAGLYLNLPSPQNHTVEVCNRPPGVDLASHLYKSEAARISSFMVGHDFHGIHQPITLEQIAKLIGRSV